MQNKQQLIRLKNILFWLIFSASCFSVSITVQAKTKHWQNSDYIVRSFSTIALNSDFTQQNSKIRKWDKNINYYFVHGITDQPLHEELTKKHLQHLARITGLNIRQTDQRSQANLVIMFSREKNMLTDFIRETGIKATPSVRKLARQSVCLSNMRFNPMGDINHATVMIPVDRARERAKLLTCIVEELSEVMGLPNDSESVYPSIFNDKSYHELLTGLDYLMLKMLYDNRIKAGMDKQQAEPILKKIVREYQQKNIVQTAELKVMEGELYPLFY